jgi:two-component system phosphate regulon sensor histidine kinase PhoR
MEKQARLVDYIIRDAKTVEEIDSLVKQLRKEIHFRITIILSNGLVVGESEKSRTELGDHSDRPEIIAARKNGVGISRRYSITVKKYLHYFALRTRVLNQDGFIRISAYDDQLQQHILLFRKKMVRYSFILYLILILIFATVTAIYRKKIHTAIQFINHLMEGRYRHRLTIDVKDEIGYLLSTMNQLAERLETLEIENQREKTELKVVIDGISDLICVIQTDEKIRLYNKAFRKFFQPGENEVRYFWEMIPVAEFTDLVRQTFSEKKNQKLELEFKENFFEVTLNYIAPEDNVVAIFHNISERKQVERMKRDFVANVSHELKTPLTALQGYLETMQQEPESIEGFLPIVMRNVFRLKRIVDDLLSLSKLESERVIVEFQPTDIHEICRRVVQLYAEEARKKGLHLFFEPAKEEFLIVADPHLLEELIINLVDNAIRYTDQGYVKIQTRKAESTVRVIVSDTGIGIPTDKVDQIFERFFVVDKGRSKRSGGTGLGLSIVKHIVQLHKGSIRVESEPEKGTRFIVELPF